MKRLISLLFFTASLANAESRPNFVVIMVDALLGKKTGFGDLAIQNGGIR
jgi:hypothetical protein